MSNSSKAKKFAREIEVDQYLDIDGVLYLWSAVKGAFVEKETGKVLSSNDFTDELKAKLEGMQSGGGTADAVAWENITGKPTNLVTTPEMNTAINAATNGLVSTSVLQYELDAIDQDLQGLEDSINARPTEEQVDQKINDAVSSVYRFAGSVPSYSNLPTSGMEGGDVYNVEDTDMNYGWVEDSSQPGGGYWDPLGTTFKIEPIPNSVIQQIVEGTYGQ